LWEVAGGQERNLEFLCHPTELPAPLHTPPTGKGGDRELPHRTPCPPQGKEVTGSYPTELPAPHRERRWQGVTPQNSLPPTGKGGGRELPHRTPCPPQGKEVGGKEFCGVAQKLEIFFFSKETYNFEEPTNRSQPTLMINDW